MSETEIDEVDLVICDLLALLKMYRIGLSSALDITTERMIELYPEVPPAPVIH